MAFPFRLNTSTMLVPRHRAPDVRLAKPLAKRAAVWPTVSIVVLLCFSGLMPAVVLTVMNATLLALVLAVVLIGNRPINRTLLIVAIPFLTMVVIGLASGAGADWYSYFKDAWYVINPVLVIAIGYVLYVNKPDIRRGLRAFILGGLIVGLWQIRGYYFAPDILLLPAESIRRIIGAGFYAPVLALVILIVFVGQWRSGLKLWGWLAVLVFVVMVATVAGVFSRTSMMVVAIGAAAAVGAFAKREWLRLGLPLAVLLVVAYSAQVFVDVESDRAMKTFVGKTARSLHELTVNDYSGLRDINLRFRGHETARAVDQWASGDILQLLFGRGFGALVDLGVYLPLEFDESGQRINVRYISVLHNGYAYLLTKAGAVAVALFAFVLGYLYIMERKKAALPASELDARLARLLQAAVVTLAATTYVVGGAFNKQDMFPFLLLIGYLIAYFRNGEEDWYRTMKSGPATQAGVPTHQRIQEFAP